MEAEKSIGYVRSGDAVTATLIAPQIGTVVEHDTSITTDHPYPRTPASIKQQLLDEAAAVYADLPATRSQLAADIADLIAEFTAQKGQEAAGISQQRAGAAARAADAYFAALSELENDRGDAAVALDAARQVARQEAAALTAEIDQHQAHVQKNHDSARAEGNRQYTQLSALAAATDTDWGESDDAVTAAREKLLAASSGEKQGRLENWEAVIDEVVAVYMAHNSIGQPGFWESLIPVWGPLRAAIDGLQNRRYGWAVFNGAMAVLDLSVVTATVRGLLTRAPRASWRAVTRSGLFHGPSDDVVRYWDEYYRAVGTHGDDL